MTPQQQAALEGVVGRPLTPAEVAQLDPLLAEGDRRDTQIADLCTALRGSRYPELRVTELGIRDLPVAPRYRHALLQVLRGAAQQTPAWLDAAMDAAGVPAEDRPALADDLAAAHQWLAPGAPGINAGAQGARMMLGLIAQAQPDAAPACEALLALVSDTRIPTDQVSHALNVAEGRITF